MYQPVSEPGTHAMLPAGRSLRFPSFRKAQSPAGKCRQKPCAMPTGRTTEKNKPFSSATLYGLPVGLILRVAVSESGIGGIALQAIEDIAETYSPLG